MKIMQSISAVQPGAPADRRILVNGFTLIALGLSVLFLNSWDNPFVRTTVGLFWGTFFLILNGPGLVQVLRGLRQSNGLQRRSSK